MDDQWEMITSEELGEIQEAMKKSPAEGVAIVKAFLDKQKNTPLNIAITGECGSGKSSFVNALRGINNDEEGAAPTGVVETTKEVKGYPLPNHPNVTLWDLPGVGTTKFPADKYLEMVGFEKFDFFIIISAARFKENDVKLAQEIKRMGKKFYFLRSQIDSDLYKARKSQRHFDRQKTLDVIKEDCIKGLGDRGIEDPQVFLVSSFELHDFDFHKLEETLERDLPRHKRNALLYALPNISLEIIKKKKKAYRAQIKFHVLLSSAVAAVPVPGLSTAVDVALVASVVTQYVFGFGLDVESLKRLADSSGVPFSDLLSVMTSGLTATKITPEVIMKVLSPIAIVGALMAAEEASRLFLFLGIPAAMCLSGVSTYKILTFLLDLIADDAQKVFEKAVKKNTEV